MEDISLVILQLLKVQVFCERKKMELKLRKWKNWTTQVYALLTNADRAWAWLTTAAVMVEKLRRLRKIHLLILL